MFMALLLETGKENILGTEEQVYNTKMVKVKTMKRNAWPYEVRKVVEQKRGRCVKTIQRNVPGLVMNIKKGENVNAKVG